MHLAEITFLEGLLNGAVLLVFQVILPIGFTLWCVQLFFDWVDRKSYDEE